MAPGQLGPPTHHQPVDWVLCVVLLDHRRGRQRVVTDARTDRRLKLLEARVDALTTALHLLTVSAKPTSEWLDATMAKIGGDAP